ncbi:ankyrin repeat domain-containing protein [Flavobacterium sp. ACN6]|uniref:ankyrin repeat domain-containing protein n=1 Tax=Flavobacterium sp. ACN6 TaxID=1920426 RepID=UPI000BB36561|nr:ankyrin repeat domain-containing protein [Flavobacterium sp. ACN6]PBJ10066.1 Ankyrin repeats (3 copies) [Flavobacterium sp. ACN6]
MKKVVIIAGAVFVFANPSFAFNPELSTKNEVEFSTNPNAALHLAISKGDIGTVKKLIEYGFDVNKVLKDMTPLMVAARYNEFEIIKILLTHGAKPLEKNENDFTALRYAQYYKATESIAILKDLK